MATQLNQGACPTDVKISSKLSDLKLLHASWIVKLYECLKEQPEMITQGFESAGITGAVKNAQHIYEKVENPFRC